MPPIQTLSPQEFLRSASSQSRSKTSSKSAPKKLGSSLQASVERVVQPHAKNTSNGKIVAPTSNVQTHNTQTDKVQTSKVQTSKVQTRKIQTRKIQTNSDQSHLTAEQFLRAAATKSKTTKSSKLKSPQDAPTQNQPVQSRPSKNSLSAAKKSDVTAPASPSSTRSTQHEVTIIEKSAQVANQTVAPEQQTPKSPKRDATQKDMAQKDILTSSMKKTVASSSQVSKDVAAKTKRSRVPKDFAQTYGENVKERKVVVPAKERRARKTAQQREQQRALMTPDEAMLQRLSQMHTPLPSLKTVSKRRTKKWESRCGKCGVVTTFSTNASLCSRCGAIAVRD